MNLETALLAVLMMAGYFLTRPCPCPFSGRRPLSFYGVRSLHSVHDYADSGAVLPERCAFSNSCLMPEVLGICGGGSSSFKRNALKRFRGTVFI